MQDALHFAKHALMESSGGDYIKTGKPSRPPSCRYVNQGANAEANGRRPRMTLWPSTEQARNLQ